MARQRAEHPGDSAFGSIALVRPTQQQARGTIVTEVLRQRYPVCFGRAGGIDQDLVAAAPGEHPVAAVPVADQRWQGRAGRSSQGTFHPPCAQSAAFCGQHQIGGFGAWVKLAKQPLAIHFMAMKSGHYGETVERRSRAAKRVV
jgi:hypothetical protein